MSKTLLIGTLAALSMGPASHAAPQLHVGKQHTIEGYACGPTFQRAFGTGLGLRVNHDTKPLTLILNPHVLESFCSSL